MKNIKILALMTIIMFGLNSCEDDLSLTYIAQPKGDLVFSNSFLSEYILIPAASSNIGERFTWDDADFETPTNITYELQRSITGDFTDMAVVGTTSENELAVTIGKLLDYAEDAGLDNDPDTTTSSGDPNNEGFISFRLRAHAGTSSNVELVSEAQIVKLVLPENTGGEPEPYIVDLFLVGSATAPGWSENNNNPPIIRHPDEMETHSYKAYFAAGEFKLLEILGQWQPQWGAGAGAGEAALNDGTGSDPASFVIDAAGYYDFIINVGEMTYTLAAYDASGATDRTTIGIIGDATPGGWDSDTDMTQSTFDSHIWYINGVSLNDGEMKFRAENDWATNWGNNTADSGFGTQDGPNIPIEAGTYDIWLNDLDGGYILIPN